MTNTTAADRPEGALTIRNATAADAEALSGFAAHVFHETFAPDNDPMDMHAYLSDAFRPEKQAAEIERLKDAQSMAPASSAHGEIALRWRVQADGLYAVDMLVSNLSSEAQAHAAMNYVQSLFAGDEMTGKH